MGKPLVLAMSQHKPGSASKLSSKPWSKLGSGLHDVVRTRIILTNINDWKAAIDVRKEYFQDVRPVDTIMAIDRFVNPEWLIEIEADAVIMDKIS